MGKLLPILLVILRDWDGKQKIDNRKEERKKGGQAEQKEAEEGVKCGRI